MHATLRAVASFVGDARIHGRLYLIADYPGLVLDDNAGWVVGELYRLRDLAVLEDLDEYEGATAGVPEPEYRRVQREVDLIRAESCPAWIYEYCGPLQARPRILSGDFLRLER